MVPRAPNQLLGLAEKSAPIADVCEFCAPSADGMIARLSQRPVLPDLAVLRRI